MNQLYNYLQYNSAVIYNFLSDALKQKVVLSESRITYLLSAIVKYSRISKSRNIEIYKSEITALKYSNNIDLFIENKSGLFSWYIIQAKKRLPGGTFEDIKYNPNAHVKPWLSIPKQELSLKSKEYYLFYSGKSQSDLTQKDFTSTISSKPKKIPVNGKLYFHSIYPNRIYAIKNLFTCWDSLPATEFQFSKTEINTTGYKTVYKHKHQDTLENTVQGIEEGFAPVRIIVSKKS